MDLAKDLVFDVLSERIIPKVVDSDASTKWNEKMKSAQCQARRYLKEEKGTTIQVMMGHDGCKVAGGKCPVARRLEVWVFKLHNEPPRSAAGRPSILPLFLKQALRSQLHFSPFRSWLTAKETNTSSATQKGLFPFIRVSANDKFPNWPPEQVHSHEFPACCVPSPNGTLWLQLEVHWLRREYFLDKVPKNCQKIEVDWVLPEMAISDEAGRGEYGCPSPSCSDWEGSSDGSMPNSPMGECKESFGKVDKKQIVRTDTKPVVAVGKNGKRSPTPRSRNRQGLACRTQSPQTTLNLAPSAHLKCRPVVEEEELGSLSVKKASSFSPIGSGSGGQEDTKIRDPVRVLSPRRGTPFRRPGPARLICNFEESILNGRLVPTCIVDGYRLQLTVLPANSLGLSAQQLTIPAQTLFYEDMPDNGQMPRTPTLLHMARCELETDGISIPHQNSLQAVLLNPQGSVVKIFIVEVDVKDMPPSSTTFIRHRTFADETGIAAAGASDGGAPPSSPKKSALRFLIHLRLASNQSGSVRLHTDIRMLFSNKANDLEGLEGKLTRGAETMRSVAEMPKQPKYSPIK